ncbi:hypothetical protein C5S30_04245 [ANME-1 cluster archaeon GoMg4]|nr:hypothetical protein [ANME-1 cluster archaeon GoMg4]
MPLRRGEGKKLSEILALLVIFSISFAVLATFLPAVSADTDGIVTADAWLYSEDGAPVNHTVIGEGEKTTVTLEVSSTVETETVPVDVMHIIDRSGSMDWENKLEDAKTAAKTFNGFLGSNDKVGLVSYSTTARRDKGLTSNIVPVNNAIDKLVANGATNIGDGIGYATNEIIDKDGRPEAIKVELLLTDGLANKPYGYGWGEDIRDIEYAYNKAQAAADNGIVIFTIGLGSDVNATMLQHIADITGGKYYFAPSGGDLQRVYEDISEEIETMASSMHAYFTLADGIEYADDPTIPDNISGNILTWDIGKLEPSTPWTVSFDVLPKKGGKNIPVNKVLSGVTYNATAGVEKALMTAGGCWILSPEDPAVKATFGFVVQQKEGEDPSGELEFQDHAIDLNLHSESIDTLTISGTTSTFSGTATVNGESGYWFEVYVEDNGKSGDVFQITITGPDVDYYAGGELAGGNIVLHSGGSSGFVPFPKLFVKVKVRPVAIFTYSPANPGVNETVEFDASDSYDPDGDILFYRWDFGDGNSIEVPYDGIGYIYGYEAIYTVTLEVEDNDELTNKTTRYVTVGESVGHLGNVTGGLPGISVDKGRKIGQKVNIDGWVEVRNTDVNTTADVIVKLYVDGMLLSQTQKELGLSGTSSDTQNITIPTKWIPMSSGWHRVEIEAWELGEDGDELPIAPYPYAGGSTEIYIQKVGKK